MPPRKKQKTAAPKPAAPPQQPPQAQPTEEAPTSLRWPLRARVLLVASLLKNSSMTVIQAETVANGTTKAHWPGTVDWDPIYAEVNDWFKRNEGTHGKTLKGELPSERTIRDESKKLAKLFLQKGHVFDKPPHEKGYKVRRNKPLLRKIFNMLRAGYTDQQGQTCIFRSLRHLEALKPEAKRLRTAAYPAGCGLKTLRQLWVQLRQAHPSLVRVTAHQKKQRDRQAVQVCADDAGMCTCLPELIHDS